MAYKATPYKDRPDGFEVYNWPEFKALCKRLGVPWDIGTKDVEITLRLSEGETVMVTHRYLAQNCSEDSDDPEVR